MIDIVCDKCDRTFSVDEDEAGGKVPCPDCGDINRVPSPAAAPPPPAASPASAARRASEPEREVGSERELTVVRPAMFRAHPARYLIIVAMFVGGIVLAAGSRSWSGFGWVLYPGILVSLGALGWFGSWWISAHWWVRLVISNKRSVRHEGIIRRHTTEVLHDHVRSVDINQTFLQRIFSVGSIGIDSAGQEGIEIQVKDIPKPYEVKALIDQYRDL